MNDKKAAEILSRMLHEHTFAEDEVEAVKTAIGILSWTKLIESRRESQRKRRERDNRSV